jgi:hypothetical protein
MPVVHSHATEEFLKYLSGRSCDPQRTASKRSTPCRHDEDVRKIANAQGCGETQEDLSVHAQTPRRVECCVLLGRLPSDVETTHPKEISEIDFI